MPAAQQSIPMLPNIIGGESVKSTSSRKLEVTNPSTGEVMGEVPLSTSAELDQAVKKAAAAQKDWA
ncbi:MAG TPA: aldehyde dehydrogenase family protein, partial [Candidatus Sumerlaeota bacterium]|nr:aldehyde dehydrogenase family protein [Candidatus Sumerlaeota bacterium]